MIFFTTFVTLIRRRPEGAERRLSSPARVEGNTLRLPIGTEVDTKDYVEHRPPHSGPQLLVVIDVVRPHMPGAGNVNDHIEVTCVPCDRVATPPLSAPTLHPAMVTALELAREGQTLEAILEALRLVETRVRSLGIADDWVRRLIESVFGTKSPQLAVTKTTDVTRATNEAAEDEPEIFRRLSNGAIFGLQGSHDAVTTVPITLDEALEYLAVASMVMRRLDRAQT